MAEQGDRENTPVEEAADNLAEVAAEAEEAVQEAVEVAHDAAIEPAQEAGETIAEATNDATEAVEDAVEAAVAASPHLSESHYDEIVNRVMARLHSEGHLGSPAEPEAVLEDAVAAPEVLAAEAPINPVREHWYFRPRSLRGKRG